MITKLLALTLFLITRTSIGERLPKTVIPINYNLTLNINPTELVYNGSQTIEIDVESTKKDTNTTEIKIHADPQFIIVTGVAFNTTVVCSNTSQVDDIVTLSCNKKIIGNGFLQINFTSKFSTEDMFGFYKSTYTENDTEITLVATQFEATYARRAFPCFDEPKFKATFDITLVYPSKYVALSNTNGIDVVMETHTTTTFKTTPRMSTYLVAFVVSEFDKTDIVSQSNYTFSVFSRPDAIKYTGTAFEYGPKLIDAMSNFTGVSYANMGNDKMTLIAIPDFTAGAMENWGLITYREVYLLDEANQTSNDAKQKVITSVAHELAHQWFGDYVTLGWWSETWLNEGFATYFQYYIAHEVDASLELDKLFVVEAQLPVFQVDVPPSADPLSSKEEDIQTNAQAETKFITISYSKGGSIVRMLRFILGEENFKDAVKEYLSTYKYNNTKASDLLSIFEKHVPNQNLNLTQNMYSWIYNPGFPLVEVSLNNNTIDIQSKGSFPTSNNTTNSTWYIPISYTTEDETNFDNFTISWLEPEKVMNLNVSDDSWLIVNLQASGFYRVNYDATLWSRIALALKSDKQREKIHVLNRAMLIDDVFNIAAVDLIDYETAFNLTEYLVNETSYFPWYSAISAFNNLLKRIDDFETKQSLKERILDLLENVMVVPSSANQNTNLSHVEGLLQSLLLNTACELGHEKCSEFAKEQFEKYRNNSSSLEDNNLRDIIFCNALRYTSNSSEYFEFLFNVYNKSDSPNEKISILNSLGCSNDTQVLSEYLLKTITKDSGIRKQDTTNVFSAVCTRNPIGLDVAFDFLVNNSDVIPTYYTEMGALGNIVRLIARRITTDDQLNKLGAFLESSNNTNVMEVKDVVLALAKSNKEWIGAHREQLRGAIVNESTDSTSTSSSTTISSTTSTSTKTTPTSTTHKPNGSNGLIVQSFGVVLCALVVIFGFNVIL